MTLSAAISSATSSLRAIQSQLTVASNNIANADDVTYAAKTARQATRVSGGVGSGVDVTAIASKVDANLVRGIVAATAADASAAATQDYLQALSDALGTLSSDGSGDTLATRLSSLESTLDQLATTPESQTLKAQAVTGAEDAAATLRTASADIQTLRANADDAIADAVQSVNDALHQIDALNDDIIRNQAAGKSTADLEDQRNAALQTLAQQMDITYFNDSNGRTNVYSGSGQVLVGAGVHELSFTATGTVTAGTTYPGGLSGVTVNGNDITNAITGGAIGALVTLRDTTLPAVQTQLDAVAVSLRDTINTIANQGSAAPPPNTLTGTASVSSADALAASGTLRVAVTDADGNVVTTQDLMLSSYGTIGDLVGALDGIAGVSASLDGDGHLVLTADAAGNGVAVAGGSIAGKTVSAAFGLNDVLTGSTAANLTVTSDLAADSSRLPVGALSTGGTLAAGDVAVSTGSGTLAQSLADAMRAASITSAAGGVVTDVGIRLASAKTRASSAETTLNTQIAGFSSSYGVNVDEETARISELQNAYSASAQVLSAVKSMFDDLLQAVR